jgi:hypothetical protein
LASKLCRDQSIKLRLGEGEKTGVKTGRGVIPGCCLSPILFNLHSVYLTKEALEGFGDFKIVGQVPYFSADKTHWHIGRIPFFMQIFWKKIIWVYFIMHLLNK